MWGTDLWCMCGYRVLWDAKDKKVTSLDLKHIWSMGILGPCYNYSMLGD
jgi:hypothetical protein